MFKNVKGINFNNFDENELIEFRSTRILLGLAPSQLLFSATLIKHMSQFIKEDPIFVETLLNLLRADNENAGASSVEAGYKFHLKAKQKFEEGGFNLRNFRSNSRKLEQIVTKELQNDISNENCIQGSQWDKFDDKFIFDISNICEKIPKVLTKRSSIQFIPSISDPLGLLNPVTANLKILIQDICSEKFTWDDISFL